MEIKSHLGVYAVILNGQNDSILLIKKARGPYTGLFDLPGGSIEADELVDEALDREVDEETSCTVVSKRQLKTDSVKYQYTDPKDGQEKVLRHIGILYSATVTGEPSQSGDGLDSDGAVWLKISKIVEEEVTPFVVRGLSLLQEGTT